MTLEEIVRQLRQPHGASRSAEVAAADLLEAQAAEVRSLRKEIEHLEWKVKMQSSMLEDV